MSHYTPKKYREHNRELAARDVASEARTAGESKDSNIKKIMLDRAKRNLSKKEAKKDKLNKKVDSFVDRYHGWPLSGGYDKDSDSHITEKRALRAQQKLGKDRD